MGLRKSKRLEQLSNMIAERASLHIKDAAELLDVSEMTIRRDIRENSDRFGYLGGHIMAANQLSRHAPYDLGHAAEENAAEKQAACRHSLEFIQPEDTVFVDCGTTMTHLVEMLPEDLKVTIVCYALNIADHAIRKSNVRLILIGGEFHPATASFSGLRAETMFEELAVNTGFFSAAGFDTKLGATCVNFHEIAQKRAAMQSAQRSILTIDSSKLGVVQAARFASFNDFDHVFTENGQFDVKND